MKNDADRGTILTPDALRQHADRAMTPHWEGEARQLLRWAADLLQAAEQLRHEAVALSTTGNIPNAAATSSQNLPLEGGEVGPDTHQTGSEVVKPGRTGDVAAAPAWIPLDDSGPDVDGPVLACGLDPDGNYWREICSGDWLRDGAPADFATHWMPLPPAPRSAKTKHENPDV